MRLDLHLQARTHLLDQLVKGLLVFLQVLVQPEVRVYVILLVDVHSDAGHYREADVELLL